MRNPHAALAGSARGFIPLEETLNQGEGRVSGEATLLPGSSTGKTPRHILGAWNSSQPP